MHTPYTPSHLVEPVKMTNKARDAMRDLLASQVMYAESLEAFKASQTPETANRLRVWSRCLINFQFKTGITAYDNATIQTWYEQACHWENS